MGGTENVTYIHTNEALYMYTRTSGPYGPLKILAPAESLLASLARIVRFAHIYLFINIIIAATASNKKCLSLCCA